MALRRDGPDIRVSRESRPGGPTAPAMLGWRHRSAQDRAGTPCEQVGLPGSARRPPRGHDAGCAGLSHWADGTYPV